MYLIDVSLSFPVFVLFFFLIGKVHVLSHNKKLKIQPLESRKYELEPKLLSLGVELNLGIWTGTRVEKII